MTDDKDTATAPAVCSPLDCGVGPGAEVRDFAKRCELAAKCLPKAEYRQWLERLHCDMLAEIARLTVGHERYETVRRMNVPQFRDAFVLNTRTDKPFDEIVDDLRPFLRPNVK